MTGMRNRMSVARCCCDCEDCCNGAYPTEWDASVTIGDSTCTTCDEFIEGTYNLTFTGGLYTGLGTCSWGYYWQNSDPFERDSCFARSSPYAYDGMGWAQRYIKMRITCISTTQYLVRVVLGISTQGANPAFGGSGGNAQKFEFQEYVDVADWACDEVADYCIPLSFWSVAGTGTDFWNGYGWRAWTGAGDVYKKLCEPPTEICLTAIP